MDNFKKYLRENQEKMDVDTPGDAVWQQIQQHRTKKIPVVKMIVAFAAAACVLAFIIAGFYGKNEQPTHENLANAETIDSPKMTAVIPQDTILPQPDLATNTAPAPPVKNKPVTIKTKQPVPEKKVSREMAIISHLEGSYTAMADLQLQKIRHTAVFAEDASYFSAFKTQLKQMEKDEADIKNFIKKNGLTDVLLDQLINVSQQKLNLLKTLQTEINKMNNQVKQNQLPSDSAKAFYLNI